MAFSIDAVVRSHAPKDFFAGVVSALTSALKQGIFNQEHTSLPGLLQHRDPRAKVVACAVLLLMAGMLHSLPLIMLLYVLVLVTACLSRLPLGFFARRIWLGIPLFAGIIALPSLFMVPGRPLWAVPMLSFSIAVTDNGLASATLLIARAGTSVSIAVLLILTTRWPDLMKALRVLRVPEAFVVVLGMTYRYIFLLLHLAESLFLARRSRIVGASSGRDQRRWIAAAGGTLVGKSIKISNDVHQAMVARGFSGQFRTLSTFRMVDADWLLLALATFVSAALLLVDRALR